MIKELKMIRKNVALKVLGFVGAFALLPANTVMAGEALSWNLSRDMMTGIAKNPTGVWSFMQNSSDVHNPSNYVALKKYYSATCATIGNSTKTPISCWTTTSGFPVIGVPLKALNWNKVYDVKGLAYFHPASDGTQPVLRWKSPINGTISILGKVSHFAPGCGDGISWSLEQEAEVLQTGSLNGDGAVFSVQNLAVSKGSNLYFIVNMNSAYECDSTSLDMIITSQQ